MRRLCRRGGRHRPGALRYQKLQRGLRPSSARCAILWNKSGSDISHSRGARSRRGLGACGDCHGGGMQPIVVGKPSPFMFEAMRASACSLSRADILVVGDRLETDIAGGQALGARTALVLSGVSSQAAGGCMEAGPDIVAARPGRRCSACRRGALNDHLRSGPPRLSKHLLATWDEPRLPGRPDLGRRSTRIFIGSLDCSSRILPGRCASGSRRESRLECIEPAAQAALQLMAKPRRRSSSCRWPADRSGR